MRSHGGNARHLEELSQFLRSRRARLSPGDLGLTVSSRRRTPGLRREEVAVLAGVGTSWYTWLEQGRDINVSESVARAIGRALRLSPSERTYMFRLLGIRPPLPESGERRHGEFASVVQELMPSPALVLDEFWNLLDHNKAAREVFGLSDSDENMLVSFFVNEEHQGRYVDPRAQARLAVAQFRTDIAQYHEDPRFFEIVDDLRLRSELFATLWHGHEVQQVANKDKHLLHPRAGRLSFSTLPVQMSGNERIRMILCIPKAGTGTRDRLASLLHDQPVLAAVGGCAR